MQIEPQPTANAPATDATQRLQRLGWLAPDEAEALRSRADKLERACGGAAVMLEDMRAALLDLAKHVWRGDMEKLRPETLAVLGGKQ